MARIAILTHAYDDFGQRPYMIAPLIPHWRSAGHTVEVAAGLDALPEADLAILHVDLSLVPEAYAEACRRYPRVINGRALDIRKRHVSRIVLGRNPDWNGPVIVKTNLNHGGMAEMHAHARARLEARADLKPPADLAFSRAPYEILAQPSQVPDAYWDHPGIVVEPFLPERDERGYWIRVWVFLGREERNARFLGSDPLVKSANITLREPCEVPAEIRAERERLGFDYGKFDYVVHQGRPILLDANRTPFAPSATLRPDLAAAEARMASGIRDWLEPA